jgi:hypothetical protein
MNTKTRWLRGFLAALSFAGFALSGAGSAFAEGPVSAAAVPGNVVSVAGDNDAGTGPTAGEQWGRPGGRTINFTVGNASAFSTLVWGVVNGTVPTVAFDNSLTPNTSEYMTFDQASNLAGGVARWHGAASLQLANASAQFYNTRFTLTVTTTGGTPVALAFANGTVNPGVNVMSSGSFKANLLFEMESNGSWGPLLTVYDGLPTIPGPSPGTPGPVLSGVSTGFYYTTGANLTIEQHDAHITGLLGSIKDDTAFMRIDLPGHLQQIGNDAGEIRSQISGNIVPSLNQILQVVSQPGSSTAATPNDVNQAVNKAKSDLSDIILILFGISPCPPQAGPICTTAKFIKDLSTQASVDLANVKLDGILIGLNNAQGGINTLQGGLSSINGKLDNLQATLGSCSEAGTIMVQAVDLDAKDKQARWLVKTTQDGVLVNAVLSRLLVVRSSKSSASVLQDVTSMATATTLGNGVHDISLNVVKNVSDGNAYIFEVRRVDGSCTLLGTAMVTSGKHDD